MWLSVNGYAQQEISAEQYTEKSGSCRMAAERRIL